MLEPITDQTRELATITLLRSTVFYRGIVQKALARNPNLILEILDEDGKGESRKQSLTTADNVIKAWADFLEIRNIE